MVGLVASGVAASGDIDSVTHHVSKSGGNSISAAIPVKDVGPRGRGLDRPGSWTGTGTDPDEVEICHVRRLCLCGLSDPEHRPDGLGLRGPCRGRAGSSWSNAFLGNRELADSVNHLLVVGFYLINVGFVSLALKYGDKPTDLETAIESLSTKMGFVLLVLGGMHFFNLIGTVLDRSAADAERGCSGPASRRSPPTR